MSNFQLNGELVHVSPRRQVSDKFTVRDLVLRTDGQYPQTIIFQLTNAKCDQADNLQPGEQITVHFNLRGREWTSPQGEVKYFNTLEAWRIERGQGAPAGGQEYSQDIPEYIPSGKDDLPF